MMNTADKRKYGLSLVLILALALSACGRRTPAPPPAAATDTASAPGAATPTGAELPRTVTLNEIRNEVQERPEQNETLPWNLAANGTVVQEGGQVRTLENATARLDFSEGTIVRLAPKTTFTIEKLEVAGGNFFTRLLLQAGKIWIILRGGEMDVDTPIGVASVRGSYLSVEVIENEDGTNTIFITCLEGDCTLHPGGGEAVNLSDGQTGMIMGDPTTQLAGPVQAGVMSPEDLSEWLQQNPEATVVVPSVTPLVHTRTPSGAATLTSTPTRGATPTPTGTPTRGATLTPTRTPTRGATPTPTRTATRTPTRTTTTITPTRTSTARPGATSTRPPPTNTQPPAPPTSTQPPAPPTNTQPPPPSDTPGVIASATPPIVGTP